jgi:hypothetical protein
MVNTSINTNYPVEEITQVGRKGRSHGHKYDGADFDESMVCPCIYHGRRATISDSDITFADKPENKT